MDFTSLIVMATAIKIIRVEKSLLADLILMRQMLLLNATGIRKVIALDGK